MARSNQLLDPSRTGPQAEQLKTSLRSKVVGQDEAIDQIVNLYQAFLAGMTVPGRPIGTLLFLGPTGSGKTRLVEAAAESLVGDARAVIKIDCAEFQHSHEIAKLIGSPPGYLGHRDTHALLSQQVLNQYHTDNLKISFVLFDEIEKASDALWNLLLGILDKATLTLGDNQKVDFSRAVIFMTGNLGAREMEAILRPALGFTPSEAGREPGASRNEEGRAGKASRAVLDAARRRFSPEFINRIDKILVFRPLGEPELRRILRLELSILQRRIFTSSVGEPFVFSLTEAAEGFLLREGTDVRYGARHLKRAVERELVYPLSNLIATAQVHGGDLIRVDYGAEVNDLTFDTEAEDLPASVMAQFVHGLAPTPVAAMVQTNAGFKKAGGGARRSGSSST